MKLNLRSIILVILTGISTAVGSTELEASETDADRDFIIEGELGFLSPISHRIQYGSSGTEFDYVGRGGQDNLFEFRRLSARIELSPDHELSVLYQPLDLRTRSILRDDITIDGETFSDGTPMAFRYSFPFYRFGYHYIWGDNRSEYAKAGFGVQFRNATIDFRSLDGEQLRSNRDVGLVPLLRFASRKNLGGRFWWEFEADGFYAPIRYLNVSDTDVIGAIWDTSLRAGHPLGRNYAAFLNLRYLGGGNDGTSAGADDFGDGYVSNWLHLVTVSLGLRFQSTLPR